MAVDTRIRQLLLDDPTLSVAELQAYFSSQDLHPSRLNIDAIRSEFLDTLRFLQARGVIRGRCRHPRTGRGIRYRDR